MTVIIAKKQQTQKKLQVIDQWITFETISRHTIIIGFWEKKILGGL
jgi:lipid-A-disaccharide synthase-like uncharacterized protein